MYTGTWLKSPTKRKQKKSMNSTSKEILINDADIVNRMNQYFKQ